MKANELMIGDWVQVAKDVCIKKDTIVKVRSIDGDNSFPEEGLKGCATCEPIDDRTLSGGVWVKFLAPIPLTAEILKKNGWKWNAFHTMLDLVIGTIHIGWGFYKDCLSVSDWSDEGHCQISSLRCIYVHELQHALKLCEIDKEIVL